MSSGKKDAVTVKGNQTLYRLQYNHKIHAFSLCKFHVYRKSKISWSKTPCHPPLPLHPPSTRIHFRKREVNIATKKKNQTKDMNFRSLIGTLSWTIPRGILQGFQGWYVVHTALLLCLTSLAFVLLKTQVLVI